MVMASSSADRPLPVFDPGSGPVTARLTRWADRYRWAVLVLVVGTYLLAYNGEFRGQPDTGLHLTIARSLYMGEGFVHPLGDEVRANPGLAYLLAGTMHLAGPEPFALAHAVIVGLALATLAVAFCWFRLHLGRPAAVLLTATLGLSVTFFQYAFYLMTDMPFLLGAMLFLWGWDRLLKHHAPRLADLLLLAAGMGIMVAFRTVAITFLGAVAVALVWHVVRSGDRRLWITGGAVLGVCVVGMAAAVISSHGTASEDGPRIIADTQIIAERFVNFRQTVTEDIPRNTARLFKDHMANAMIGVRMGDVTNSVIALAVIGLGLALFRRHPLGALLVLAFVVQTLMFMVVERYYLAILPVLLLGWWQGACWCEQRRGAWRWRRGALALCFLMLVFWIVPNALRTAKFVMLQRQPNFFKHDSGGRYAAQFALRDWLRDGDSVPVGSTIVTDHRDLHVLVYLMMPLDVSVTSHRHVQAGNAVGDHIYVLEPMGADVRQLVEQQSWDLGEPVVTVPTRRASETLRLRPVQQNAAD